MEIRVTLTAMGPIPDSLLALVPGSSDAVAAETAWGQSVTVHTQHDDPDALRQALRAFAGSVAVAVVAGPLVHQPAELLLLDVDSTLTTTEAVDLLAEHAGVGPKVAEITERAMRGELDFAASLTERVATLRGLPVSVFEHVGEAMTLSDGAEDLIAQAHAAGALVGVTSGGFIQLVQPLAERLRLDFFNANELETELVDGEERLTGRVVGPVVTREQKARDLLRFAHAHDVDPALTVAVGDGANDLDMFAAAGLSVAYCAKPITAERADVAINFPRLDAVAAFAFPAEALLPECAACQRELEEMLGKGSGEARNTARTERNATSPAQPAPGTSPDPFASVSEADGVESSEARRRGFRGRSGDCFAATGTSTSVRSSSAQWRESPSRSRGR